MGLKYPRTKGKNNILIGEPCRHPQVGELIGEPCRRPQVGEPCRHPRAKGTNEEYPSTRGKKERLDLTSLDKEKVLDLMSLDKMSQPSRKTVEVNALEENKKIKFTVDSGAAETVCEKSDAEDFPTIYGGGESLTKHIMPNGEIVENDGEKHLKVNTAEGEKFIVRTQLTDVRKPLMSVSKICDEGNIVVFKQNGGYIQNEKTGKKTSFSREGNVYALEMDLVSDFTGPAK
jgi:hypothetical protein